MPFHLLKHSVFCWFTLFQLLSFNINAGDFEEGIAAASQNDFKKAYNLWLPLADEGNVKAQHNLGFMYQTGLGLAQNYNEALKWYKLAADQGYAESQNNLAYMYDKGLGTKVDYLEAVKWYQLAAKKNHAQA